MFDDRFLLTKAVFRGVKTNTRRDELTKKEQEKLTGYERVGAKPQIIDNHIVVCNSFGRVVFSKKTRYKVGEIVAVAQSYRDAGYKICHYGGVPAGHIMMYKNIPEISNIVPEKGWENKMYVKPELMPMCIRMNNVRIERLQDISDEDCIKEGILQDKYDDDYYGKICWR